ncbi:MAG: NAD(P)/FAD-dependent oxidoreductase [Candidatus Omnitrophica bacterium]|nr:NAD(P)/FAD-dependent oxidoreductase [Candidatus Omnitrophota bacterium]
MKKDEYDVIIVGAGIGGLVSGCYLAKSGFKVLIIEKNDKPGGYCASFKKGDFFFDACAHSIGGGRLGGSINRVLEELGVLNRVNLRRFSPSDIIISPDYKVAFHSSLNKTIEEFQRIFPKYSKKIDLFFHDISQTKRSLFFLLRNETLSSTLFRYFDNNEKLKAAISFLLLGNAGLPPSLISSFSSYVLLKEFILDGGYYPDGGMQSLSNKIAERFKEFGGQLLLTTLVKKFEIKNNSIKAVELMDGNSIKARYFVSACDSKQTLHNLLGFRNEKFMQISQMMPALSMFILYLGVNDKFIIDFPESSNVWYLPHYDIEKLYLGATNRNMKNIDEYMVRILPNKKTLVVFVNSNFRRNKEWSDKNSIANALIKKIEKIFPSLSKFIDYQGIATPYALYSWTLNYKGAAYGWAAIPSQLLVLELLKIRFVNNLYLAGHWSTVGHGLNGAMFSGFSCANTILKTEGRLANHHD